MDKHNEQIIKDIKVVGVEKPNKGKFQEHFEYVIRVFYDDNYEHLIFRRYSMLFDFHAVLKEVVKDNYNNVVVLPELPVAKFQHAGRKFLRLGMNKEIKRMTEYCQKIIQLPKFISEKDIIVKFFDVLGTDKAHAEAYLEEHQKDLRKEQTEPVTSPNGHEPLHDKSSNEGNENMFRSVADFDAVGTGELSVKCGEIVTVIEKNPSGWWLVSNTAGETGFTPATFLDSLEVKENNVEEWVEVHGHHNTYYAIKDYTAQCPDELSFRCGEELEVTAMSNYGWWRARRGNEVGLCPASSLDKKSITQRSYSSSFHEDPMNEYRKNIQHCSKKSSHRERGAPPRTSSKKSENEYGETDPYYTIVKEDGLPKSEEPHPESSVKYSQVIPKNLRTKDPQNPSIRYMNIPVIKDGVPHYVSSTSDGKNTEAINMYVVRKEYRGQGLHLQEGDSVQVISVMPDKVNWKVATIEPPYQDGLIPSEYLCPELPNQTSEAEYCNTVVLEGGFTREPVLVLPRFTKPPTTSPQPAKKPVPAPRTTPCNKSPSVSPKTTSLVALESYTSVTKELLTFTKGDVGRLVNKKQVESGWLFIEVNGKEGWVPCSYWKDTKNVNDKRTKPTQKHWDWNQWFAGRMSRNQCEELFLERGKHLNFLIRESVQRVDSYAISVKFNDKVHHFSIEKTAHGKLNIGKLSFNGLTEIIAYYALHPLFYTDNMQPVSIGEPLYL